MRIGRLDLSGGRWVPFEAILRLKGKDLSGADFRMQVRTYRDATGDPLIDFGAVATPAEQGVRTVYAGSATIDQHITAARLDAVPEGSLCNDSLVLTLLDIRIFEATMRALPFPAERGNDAEFAWDLNITPSGDIRQTWLAGKFTVLAGVTK
jgi:hypothetical protein